MKFQTWLLRVYKLNGKLPGIALIPQSITTAPGFTHDPLTSSGCPIPTTKMSACDTYRNKRKIQLSLTMINLCLFERETYHTSKIFGSGMANRDGGVVPLEQFGYWGANDLTPSENDSCWSSNWHSTPEIKYIYIFFFIRNFIFEKKKFFR